MFRFSSKAAKRMAISRLKKATKMISITWKPTGESFPGIELKSASMAIQMTLSAAGIEAGSANEPSVLSAPEARAARQIGSE